MTEHFCELHKTELIEDSVPILYGTFAPESTYIVAERNNTHPFANAFVRGPCWVESETHTTVRFCPSCREIWLKTSEGVQFINYSAKDKPTLEQDAERLRAQLIGNARYARNLKRFRIACYSIMGAAICGSVSYFFTSGLAFSVAIGGFGGVVAGMFVSRRTAQQCIPADAFRRG